MLTFAVSLVHDLQVWVSHAAGHQQSTLIGIWPPVAAAHSVLLGNVRAVWRAHTLRPSYLHFANLPGTTFDSIASLYKSTESGFICECQCNVTVLTSLQTSGEPQAFSSKISMRSGVFPDQNTIFTLHNIYNNHISLLTVTHRGVSPGGIWGWRVFITDLCVRLHTDWAKLPQRDGGALR